jgi:hypothetical protein
MGKDIQKRFDAAVVVATILRPSLIRAVQSVFRQDLNGRIQVLIGIDKHLGGLEAITLLRQECPDHICLTVIDLGYSTSIRHGGIYPTRYGGGTRTILSYAANSKLVAYLDDDDWWARDHLSSLIAACNGKGWAFSYRWMVDEETAWPICRDEWDSVGPNRGINKDRFGGFVATSNLILDKQACHFVLPLWSLAAFPDSTGEDRLVFDALLKHHPWAATGKFSCYYELRREHQLHPHHAREFAARGLHWISDRREVATIRRMTQAAAASLECNLFDETISTARGVLSLNPFHAETLYLLAKAEWKLGRAKEAAAHIKLAREVDDSDPRITAAAIEICATM